MENSAVIKNDKLRANTVAVSNPASTGESLGPTLARTMSVPPASTNEPIAPVNLPANIGSIIDFSKLRKTASKEAGSSRGVNENVECAADQTKASKVESEIMIPELDGVVEQNKYDSVVLHPLNEILPLSRNESVGYHNLMSSLQGEASLKAISETKDWVPPEIQPDEKQNKQVQKNNQSFLMMLILLVLAASLVPAVFFAVHGSQFSLMNFFSSLSSTGKDELIEKLVHANEVLNSGEKLSRSPFGTSSSSVPIFDGLVYSPKNSMEPACGFTRNDAILDLELLSSVTSKIRMYGTQCNQVDYILDGIQHLKLNMTVMMGIWINGNQTEDKVQFEKAQQLLQRYPAHLFSSVMIGDEAIYRGDITEAKLIELIKSMKKFMAQKKLDIPVGTCELGPFVSGALLDTLDVVGVNVLPFFTGLPAQDAAQWTSDYLASEIVPLRQGNCSIVISEVGWPYAGGRHYSSVANARSYQKFMNTWVCNTTSLLKDVHSWYYFEAFDEPWKQVFHDNDKQWETEWGVFGPDREMKSNVSFPRC